MTILVSLNELRRHTARLIQDEVYAGKKKLAIFRRRPYREGDPILAIILSPDEARTVVDDVKRGAFEVFER